MIVVDVETTGVDPKVHSIVDIGALDFSDPENQFYVTCRIFEGARIDPEALEINGQTEKQVRYDNNRTLEEAIKEFLTWAENIEDRILAGQNTSFDRDFLMESALRYGIEWKLGFRTIDLHSIAYYHFLKNELKIPLKKGASGLTTSVIYAHVGLPDEPRPHKGIRGAKWEAEAISRLIYGRGLLKEFEEYQVPGILHK